MATPCSFDITSNVDLQEVDNALNQARKEVAQRYDFKGAKASIEFDTAESKLVLVAEDDFKLNALWEIVQTRLVRRNVPVRNLTRGTVTPAANSTVRQEIALQQGIPSEKAKDIVKFLKDKKLRKIQATIQADQLSVTSAVEGRAAGRDAAAARSGLRRRAAVRELSGIGSRLQAPGSGFRLLTDEVRGVVDAARSLVGRVARIGAERPRPIDLAVAHARRGNLLRRRAAFDPGVERRHHVEGAGAVAAAAVPHAGHHEQPHASLAASGVCACTLP